jgi:hypothetical protein
MNLILISQRSFSKRSSVNDHSPKLGIERQLTRASQETTVPRTVDAIRWTHIFNGPPLHLEFAAMTLRTISQSAKAVVGIPDCIQINSYIA